MAFVYKRNKIYYVGWRKWIMDEEGKPKRIQVSEPCGPDKQAADRAAARKTLEEYQDKHNAVKQNMLIDEFFAEYTANYAQKKKAPSTLIKDRVIWKSFRATCPEVYTTEDYNDTTLNNFMVRRLEGKPTGKKARRSTVNRQIGMLKNLARWGYKNRYLRSNYYDLVDRYQEIDSQKKNPFTDEQVQQIIDNTSYPQREAHILSIWHGLRAAEACTLECQDFVFDTEQPYIRIRSKPHLGAYLKSKSSERDVPIHPDWLEHIKKIWQWRKQEGPFFLVTRDNKRFSHSGLTTCTRKLFNRLKFPIKELSFHSGRHTYATRIKDGGGSLQTISKALGHVNTRVTEKVYVDFKPHEHFGVVDNLKIPIKKPQSIKP